MVLSGNIIQFSVHYKKIGTLRNLCPGEEPLRFRIDLTNLKRFSKCSPIFFTLGKSIRNLKGSFPGYRFRNIPISFRVYARVSQWYFRKYVPASNNRWCLDWIQSRVKWVEATNVTCIYIIDMAIWAQSVKKDSNRILWKMKTINCESYYLLMYSIVNFVQKTWVPIVELIYLKHFPVSKRRIWFIL